MTWCLGIGSDIMKSRTSGTYQVMPKVGMERASRTDESASFYKGKGESRFPRETTRFFRLRICITNLIALLSNRSKHN